MHATCVMQLVLLVLKDPDTAHDLLDVEKQSLRGMAIQTSD